MNSKYVNAHAHALVSLGLVPPYLDRTSIVSRATLIGATREDAERLASKPCRYLELAEVFRCVDQVIHEGQVAYVTPTNSPEYPFGAVIADAHGHVCAAGIGKNKEGLAELIRQKLDFPAVGSGEAAA